MCLDKDGKGLFNHMETTKPGVGFCCNPSSTSEFCTSGTTHGHGGSQVEILCSPDSYLSRSQIATSPYKNVITGIRNYQMFAYCPSTGNQKICGISSGKTKRTTNASDNSVKPNSDAIE